MLGAPNAAQLRESVHACHLGGPGMLRTGETAPFARLFRLFLLHLSIGGRHVGCLDFCGTIKDFSTAGQKKREKREGRASCTLL